MKNQEGLANANTALQSLYDYKRSFEVGDQPSSSLALNSAAVSSSYATEFLKLQQEPFYIGGLIGAGNVRIDVIRAQDPNYFDTPEHLNEINELIDHVASMVATLEKQVHATHSIEEYDVSIPVPEGGHVRESSKVYLGHKSHGKFLSSYNYKNEPPDLGPPPLFTRADAERRAGEDYNAGVGAELRFLMVPEYNAILEAWRGLRVNAKLTSEVGCNGVVPSR